VAAEINIECPGAEFETGPVNTSVVTGEPAELLVQLIFS